MGSVNKTDIKKDLIGRVIILALLFFALVFAAIYIVSLNSSFSWFSSKSEVTARDMQTTLSTDSYDVLVERTNEFDSTLTGGTPKYEFVDELKTKITSEGYNYNLSENSTSEAKLAYELVNEGVYNDGNTQYRFLMPGSCGTLTFYIKPKGEQNVVADIDISLSCFKRTYENDTYEITEEENDTVLDLLKGHILFFRGRTGNDPDDYKYSGLIETGNFTYDTSEHEKCTQQGKTDCYKVTLYWEWPLIYSDMAQNIGQTEGQEKYPPSLRTYIDQHREYFFIINQTSSDPQELEDGYNDADQTIGEHANFIAAYLEFN